MTILASTFLAFGVGENKVKADTVWDNMIINMSKLEDYAIEYKASSGVTSSVNLLMLNYIRSTRYTGTLWNMLTGTPNAGFDTYVASKGDSVPTLKTLGDISTPSGEVMDFVYMCATMAAKTYSGDSSGDTGGWGGDYATLCADVKSSGISLTDYNALYAKATELFRGNSSFNGPDWVSDLDGYNIMNIRNASGEKFSDILTDYYSYINEAYRVYLFSNNRLPGEQTNAGYRSRITNLFSTNGLLTLLYSQRGVGGSTYATLRQATADVVADYLYSFVAINEVSEIEADDTMRLGVGDSGDVSFTVLPATAIDRSVTFTGSDDAVATVDGNGAVTGIAPGEMTVTITSTNGTTKVVTVTVVNKYTVTFDYGDYGVGEGDLDVVSYVALDGDAFTTLVDPVITNASYEFDYWMDSATGEFVSAFPDTVGSDLNYVAIYKVSEDTKLTEGAIHTLGTKDTIEYSVNKGTGLFESVWIDGAEVAVDEAYTLSGDPTVVTLLSDYLNSLGAGMHHIDIYFSDGLIASGDLEILKAPVIPGEQIADVVSKAKNTWVKIPKTGGSLIWVTGGLLSAAGLGILRKRFNK